jgi:hypothetical protein
METKSNKRDIGWGVLMITFGVAALFNIFGSLTEWAMVGLLALGGLVCLVIFLTDRKDWVLLIPAYILLAIALIATLAITNLLQGDILASGVLAIVGTPFLVVYLFNRAENWWALIPAWVLFSVGIMILGIGLGILQGGILPLYVLAAIGLPFLVVYFTNRAENWWALIPAWVMISIGFMIALIDLRILNDLAIPAYVMFAIALPFLVVYFTNRKGNRWALIPAGVTGAIGIGFFAGTNLAQYVIPLVLIGVGALVLFGSFARRGA